MKLTKKKLQKIINEELEDLNEGITSIPRLEKDLQGYAASEVIGSLIYALKTSGDISNYNRSAIDSLYECFDELENAEIENF